MRKLIGLLVFMILLTGCAVRQLRPTLIPVPTDLPYTQCAWNWATQALPELSAKVEASLQAAGLKDVTANAKAYGENCITTGGEVDHFAAMQTDFHIIAKVADLADKDELGNLLEKMLRVLDTFPVGKVPGPQPGYVNVSFRTGNDELNMMFTVAAGKSARALGLQAAELFEKLQSR